MNILYKLVFILLSVVLVSAQVLAQTDVHFETINAPSDVNLFNHFNVKFDIDDGGNFWAGFDSSGIYKWDGNNWSMLDISVPNYPQGNVKNLEYHSSSLWIASQTGIGIRLYRYQNNIWTEYTIPNPDASINKIKPSQYSEEVFLCTNKGVYSPISGLIIDSLNTSLPSNKINDFYEPDEQTLLLATQGGLVKLTGGNVFDFNYPNSPLENKVIRKVEYTSYHGILISSNIGTFKLENSSNTLSQLILETGECFPSSVNLNSTFDKYNDSILYNGSSNNFMVVDKNSLRTQPIEILLNGVSNYSPHFIFNTRIDQTTGKSWYLVNSGSSFLFSHYKNEPFYVPDAFTEINVTNFTINQISTGVGNLGELFVDCNENPIFNKQNLSNINLSGKGGIWLSGIDQHGKVHASPNSYRQLGNEFYPGPLDTTDGSSNLTERTKFNRNWSLSKWDIENFIYHFEEGNVQSGSFVPHPDLITWPAQRSDNTNQSEYLTRFYDTNGDGNYNPIEDGDYPIISGDRELLSIFNDTIEDYRINSFAALGVELHQRTYSFVCNEEFNDDSLVNNVLIIHYDIFNRTSNDYHDVYFGVFEESSLGNLSDDYVGCYPSLNLSYSYNSDNFDENGLGNNLPIMSTLILNGPEAVLQDNIDNDNNGQIDEQGEKALMSFFRAFNYNQLEWNEYYHNDSSNIAIHNILQNKKANGTPIYYGGDGSSGTIPTRHTFPSWPNDTNVGSWSEMSSPLDLNYRIRLTSSGPFNLNAGESISYDVAFIVNYNPNLVYGDEVYFRQIEENALKVKTWFSEQNFPSCNTWFLGVKEDNVNEDFNSIIFPNPANSETNLNLTKKSKQAEIRIYNQEGKLVYNETFNDSNNIKINTNDWQPGIYLINSLDNLSSSFEKLVVIH